MVGDGGAIEVRDARTGALRRTFRDLGSDVASLAFSPDGQTLAAGRYGSSVRLWNAETGADITVLEHQVFADFLEFSPDGRRITTNTWGGEVFWDLATGKLSAQERGTNVRAARFLSDGSALVQAILGGSITVCRTADVDRAVLQAEAAAPAGSVKGPASIESWDTIAQGRHTTAVWGLAASPDGRWLATAAHDGSVLVWDAATGRLSRTLAGHHSTAWGVAFSADSRLLASSGDEIKVWEVATGRELACGAAQERLVSAVCFHPTHPWLMSGCYDGTVRLWDRDTGRALGVLYKADGAVNSVAISPDGRWAVACYADGHARVWDVSRPLTFPSPPDRMLDGHGGALWSAGFSPDGQTLATGSERGAIHLWDASTFEHLTTLRSGSGQIRSVSFSQDGSLLAGSAYVAATVVWDLAGVHKTLREMGLDWRP
jgi:WD40 repeat protein